MAPTLYMLEASPAVRSVILCAMALDLKLNEKEVNLLTGEHLTPEFLKLNPEHTVPVLDDDGFVIVDSHAINTYLVAKYGKDDSLYPKDIKKRAIVDNRLHYDSSTLFVRGLTIYKGFLFEGEKEIAPKLLIALEEAYSITEKFLENSNFIAGDHLTIADFSFITSITGWNMFFNLKEEKYPKIVAWMKRMQALPYYNEANQVGQDHFYKIVKDKLPK
ncbi:glutathione S-transferase 1-like isoform X2 [Diabrotica virgifera virgifera]|uniref:Glutathione S-transferase 1-like n=1 Tax=Diabrotica virgifera virgifera TaxID=50390 RepID=A0ABM5KTR7_DIAVI|nr:glutathione S-transferase 1-like isoform X2 [Diabrotica virgifera virgifera]